MSRHRGAKHRRRYELLGGISLLSPEYLLSVERWPFHSEPPDHYDLLSHLLAPSRSHEKYLKFWNSFGKNIKLGVIEDASNRNKLAKLLRFCSTNDPEKLISFDEYIARMKSE